MEMAIPSPTVKFTHQEAAPTPKVLAHSAGVHQASPAGQTLLQAAEAQEWGEESPCAHGVCSRAGRRATSKIKYTVPGMGTSNVEK